MIVYNIRHSNVPKRETFETNHILNRSKSKGYYRRRTRGIAWFRDTATECLSRIHEIKQVLEANGHPVTMIREERVGYVVYEDDFQVVAEQWAHLESPARWCQPVVRPQTVASR